MMYRVSDCSMWSFVIYSFLRFFPLYNCFRLPSSMRYGCRGDKLGDIFFFYSGKIWQSFRFEDLKTRQLWHNVVSSVDTSSSRPVKSTLCWIPA